MFMKYKFHTFFLTVFFLVYNTFFCSDSTSPDGKNERNVIEQKGYFAIHILRDTTLWHYEVLDIPLSELEINENAWLSIEDIEFYDFTAHCMYLKRNKKEIFGRDPIYFDIYSKYYHRPFVVTADSQRCYLGFFYPTFSSSAAVLIPAIGERSALCDPEDVLMIDEPWYGNDSRFDGRVKLAFEKAGKLKEGLSVWLHNINVTVSGDSVDVSYTFSVINNDDEDIYFPDPDKMNGYFFFYQNGLFFNDAENSFHINGESTTPEPHDSWDINWFTLLEGKNSVERTINIKSGRNIPVGKYDCYFYLTGPRKIDKTDRYINGARIWLGIIKSNTYSIEVKN